MAGGCPASLKRVPASYPPSWRVGVGDSRQLPRAADGAIDRTAFLPAHPSGILGTPAGVRGRWHRLRGCYWAQTGWTGCFVQAQGPCCCGMAPHVSGHLKLSEPAPSPVPASPRHMDISPCACSDSTHCKPALDKGLWGLLGRDPLTTSFPDSGYPWPDIYLPASAVRDSGSSQYTHKWLGELQQCGGHAEGS